MKQQLRIWSAALVLETFTAGELATFADVKLSAARAEIDRHEERYEALGPDTTRQGPGRPATRYKLLDPDAIREELRDTQEIVTLPVIEDPKPSADEDRRLFWTPRSSPSRGRAEQRTSTPARCSRRWLLRTRSGSGLGILIWRAARARPRSLLRWTYCIARTSRRLRDTQRLRSPWLPWPGIIAPMIRRVVEVSIAHQQALPIAIVTGEHQRIDEVVTNLSDEGWISRQFGEGESSRIWSPRWAEAMLDDHLLAAVIVGHGAVDAEAFQRSLELLQEWSLPLLVAGSEVDDAAVEVRSSWRHTGEDPGHHARSIVGQTHRRPFRRRCLA